MAFLAPLAAPLLEAGGAEAAGGIAGAAGAEGGGGMLGGFMGDHPFLMGNLMGRAMGGGGAPGQAAMGPSADASVAEPLVGVTGKIGADMFGEDSVGMATKNRGENSDPDEASSTGLMGEAEHGDSPEQNKDVALGPGGQSAAFAADDLQNEDGGDDDNDLRSTATNAFHSNLPLILEFAFSGESGENHPILKALDELLESAYPGYKDVDPAQGGEEEAGMDPHDPENPTEKLEGDLGQDLDNDGPADTPESEEDEDESKKASKRIAREAGYCWECWGPLDVLQRCSSCKTSGVPEGNELVQALVAEAQRFQPATPDEVAQYVLDGLMEAGWSYEQAASAIQQSLGIRISKTANEGPWEVGHRVRHVDSINSPENYATIVKRKRTPYGHAYDLQGPDGEVIPDVPHNSDLAYVDAGKPEANYFPPTGPGVFNKFPNIQPGDAQHFDPKYFPKDASVFHVADVPGPPSSVGMGNAIDTNMQTNITGVPTCPLCGQNHVAGTPCPTPQQQAPVPQSQVSPAAQNFGVPMQNNKVVTRSMTAGEFDEDELQEPRHNESYEDGETPETGWYEDWKGPDQEKHPWVDEHGEPLQEGGTYEMHSTGYAIPDRITVLAVTPNKLSYELEAGDLAYKDTITTDDVYKSGYSFKQAPVDSDPGMETKQPPQRQPLDLEHPKPPRPGDDPLPQQDDISTPPTRVSHEGDSAYEENNDWCRQCGREYRRDAEGGDGICFHCKQNNDMEDAGHGLDSKSSAQGDRRLRDVGPPPGEPDRRFVKPLHQHLWETEGAGSVPGQEEQRPPGFVEGWDTNISPDEDDRLRDEGYYGSFQGDTPDARNWLNDPGPGQGVDLDPQMMAKIAGKDFSAREQRQFIDESGEARNLHRLDLEGTHYELDGYGDSLW